jgi:hypothetical protein
MVDLQRGPGEGAESGQLASDVPRPPARDPSGPLDAWLSPVRFAVILAVLIAAFFPEVIFAGKAFVFRDFGIFTYPVAYYHRESFWRGELPLWNPLSNCGIPFLAQWNTAALYPLSLIYFVLPLTAGLSAFFLLHLFLAGFGMYLLVTRWSGSRLAAAVAGIGFVFNGLTLNCLMWVSNMAALAWMPLVILAAELAWRGGRKQMLVAAFAGTVQMLTGAPEIILFTWLIVLARWVGEAISRRTLIGRSIARLAMVILLVGVLSAAQILPFLDLLVHSGRQSNLPETIWPIPTWGWANLFVPLFRCYRSPLGVYFQPHQDWTSSYYPGIGVLALALLALALGRTKKVWLVWAAAIAGFVTALGEHGLLYPALLKLIPPVGFMRYPIKFAFLTTFSLPLLAGLGLARLQALAGQDWARAVRWTLACGCLLACITAKITLQAALHPYPGVQSGILVVNGLGRVAFLLLILTALVASLRIQRARLQIIMVLLMLASLWFDVVTHAPRQNPTVDPAVYQPMLVRNQLGLNVNAGTDRAFLNRETHDKVYGWMLTEPEKDFLGRRMVLFGNCNLLDQVPTPDGFFSLYLREQRELFIRFIVSATNGPPVGLADFLSISKVSNPINFSEWQTRSLALPWCSIGQKPVFAEDSQIPDLLLRSEFDPRRVVFLPLKARASLAVTNASQGNVRSATFASRQVDMQVEAPAAALVVISQTYYHPWRAYVDAKPVRLWRANYAFQAVEVPAGLHSVKLKYEDRWFQIGAVLTLSSLLACIIVLLVYSRKSRRSSGARTELENASHQTK